MDSGAVQKNIKVLVMDDEEFVLEMVTDILEGIGLDVVTACDGDAAVKIYQQAMQDDDPFKAVIMDLVVPAGLGGKDAIQHLLKIDPNVKAIVSSGYSNDPIMAEYRKYGFTDVIAKPYKIKELQDAVLKIVKSGS